ncbi:hypothetical protein TIFTF001_018653 [Ficus carica]|uniref:Uncharacterized protein n=1 Tax=Ficus carica TaxID=3494 RepID=A0AA88DAY4_FICCA|nr:hypothetical protein TIFTF001_018653 [Ficus carica]
MSGSSFRTEVGLDIRFRYRGRGQSLVSRPRTESGVGFRDPGRGRISRLGLENLGSELGSGRDTSFNIENGSSFSVLVEFGFWIEVGVVIRFRDHCIGRFWDPGEPEPKMLQHFLQQAEKEKKEGREGPNDENVVTGKSTWDETYSDPVLVPIGPVTRARAKKFKDALTGLIRASWSQAIAWRPIEGIISDNQPNKCVIQAIEETE